MVSNEEVLIRIKGQDQTGGAFSSVESKANSMKSTLSSAVGMAVGMVGYDLVNSLVEAGRGAINASGQLDYFAGRLKMSDQQTANFRKELDNMQRDFKKVNMTSVGATAEDLASRYQLPIDKLGDLTKMTAVMSSEFVRNGRSQEDAVLAVADAMDGQFKRLQEIGITQDTLKKNGWNGNLEDQASLIDALNKSMEDMGYDKIAKDITNLDDAWGALTVTGGNLIASVLVPITPLIIGMAEALMNAINFVQDNGWAQGAILIGALALGVVFLAGSMVTAEGAFVGWMALMPGFVTSLYTAASGFMAISVAGAPLWAILAVLAAIALAVYEVGIYFGWWTDLSSMLAAISDGVRRLWEAFINSPQVQGAIAAVKGALQDLWTFLQPMISWIQTQWNNIFGEEGSNPDVVHMLIVHFQTLGTIASTVFSLLQQGFQTVAFVVDPLVQVVSRLFYTLVGLADGSVSFEEAITSTFRSIMTGVLQFQFRLAQIAMQIGSKIFNGIMTYARRIPGMLWNLLVQAGQRILAFGNTAAARARNAGMRILNGIINYIRQLPGRVATYMMQVPGKIAAAAGSAVSAAAGLASGVVQAVQNGIVGVADVVYNEFMNIGSKINSAVSGAVSAASSFGSDIKNAVLNALSIASPGIIQRKIAIEFQDIPKRIGESNDYVYSAARDYAGNIIRGFNAPQMSLGSMGAIQTNNRYNPSTSSRGNTTIIYVQPGAAQVDARNMTEREAVGVVTAAFESLFTNPGGA